MRRETLLDFFDDFAHREASFLAYDDGYRHREYSYADVAAAARRFAGRLAAAGLVKGDKVIIWSENRPEWIVALWGCLLRGVVIVPIDYRASFVFLRRIAGMVSTRIVLVGHDVEPDGDTGSLALWSFDTLLDLPPPIRDGSTVSGAGAIHHPDATPVPISRDDVAEIIFTSGATAEPKGVVITHRNILANILPIEQEVAKYRKWARPFHPIRFLNLLPLSHMFGQALATFVPPMLSAQVIFMRGYNPGEIVRQIKRQKVSVLVSVPKLLDVIRDHLLRQFPETGTPPPDGEKWMWRWWRYRRVHRAFGLKFWSFLVGAAPLDPALEEFMGRLGFLVVQGYGLTETAPIVTLNHPFSAKKGSVGKPIHGVDVKIGDDGEILVKGDNVTRGYFGDGDETRTAFEDGWLHTGDIGGVDADGRLYIRGRKKEMIVTPEGLNVFPEDVERVLLTIAGVRDAAAVGHASSGEERVHAVLLLDQTASPEAVVRQANEQLADHQKVRSASVWPGAELPRTEGTRKLRRRELRTWVAEGAASGPRPAEDSADPVESVVMRFAHGGRKVTSDTTIDELGLSSLERVELLMALEDRLDVTIDEASFAAAGTVADLRRLTTAPTVLPASDTARRQDTRDEPLEFPAWNRKWPATAVRRASLLTWILPIGRLFMWLNVEGREHLDGLTGPVVFAANHQSHLDTPAILTALPRRWRYRVAVAMAKEFFKAHFFPDQYGRRAWFTNSLNYYLAALFFNAFPLPQREAGTRQTLRYIGALVNEGYSVLIFPEGKRTQSGEIGAFRPGVGMIGARLGLPVVPVRLDGLERILHESSTMATPGRARIAFGRPLRLSGDDYAAQAKLVEEAVKAL